MFAYIPREEYVLTSKEVLAYLNQHNSIFEKEITSSDLSNWTRNYEINAIKPKETGRWSYRKDDLDDFIYRFQNDLLHKFNASYHKRTSCRISDTVLRDFFTEENTFQTTICILVTLHPYALFNDPERSYEDLGRAEGGITFKNAVVTFSHLSVQLKDTELKLRQQRLLYPVLVAEAIKALAEEYMQINENNIKTRIIKAGRILIDSRITEEEYLNELNSIEACFRGWPGLNDRIHQEIKPMIYGKWSERLILEENK